MKHIFGKVSVVLAASAGMVAASAIAPTAADASSPLRVHAEEQGIEMGVAIDDGRLGNSQYANLAGTEFSQVTAENAMKWSVTQPSQGNFDFSRADEIVQFAQQNNQRIYGHTLVWHNQTADWVKDLGASEMDAAMQEHISTVVGRYQDDIAVWDVANEVLNGNGDFRQSFWYQTLGQDYIAKAFEYARAADPDAELCLNDYSIDGINAKSDGYYQLAQDLLAQGVPITCMGFQAHLILGQVPSDMQQNLQRFADLGLDVYVTEVDIRMELNGSEPTQQQLQQQAEDYRTVIEACLGVSRCKGVTTWGVHDASSWVPGQFEGQGAPLLWDDNFNQKPAYDAVHDTLAGDGGGGDDGGGDDGGGDPGEGTCTVDGTTQGEWGTGYVVNPVTVSNTGSSAINGWQVTFELPSGHNIVNAWNADVSAQDGTVTATDTGRNGSLRPGDTASFGFQISRPSGDAATASGYACAASP